MTIEVVLNHFDKVRKSGPDKWRVPCPVHGGKDLNMVISDDGGGSVGVWCFVCGAKDDDLADALMIDRKHFYKTLDGDYQKPVISKQMLEDEQMDRMIMAMAENTPPQTLADKRRVKVAQARLEGLEEKRRQIEESSQSVDNEVMPF